MGATTPQGLAQRAMRGLAQSFGPPLAGKSKAVAFDATNKTVTLEGGATYRLVATAACFLAAGATSLTAANQEYLQPNWDRFITVPISGLTLNVSQVTAAGILYLSKLDDVE